MTIWECDIRDNLILLYMLDFNIILGIDMLSPYRAILYCFAKTITLSMLSIS